VRGTHRAKADTFEVLFSALNTFCKYSEDLDFVRSTNTPIGPFIDQLRGLGEMIGMKVNIEISCHPKVYLRSNFEDGDGRMRIKIEMDAFETSPAFDPIRVPFRVDSRWWPGTADVKTFRVEEFVATKLRALYQRRKGRDLFDLWLALNELDLIARLEHAEPGTWVLQVAR
jgi:predicted nucleotidyltransferase component of viral defense system